MPQPALHTLLTETPSQVRHRELHALTDLLATHQNRCVLFGAGTLGRRAVILLRELGIEPLAIADTNPARWGQPLDPADPNTLTVLSPAAAASQFGAFAIFFVTIWNDFHWFTSTAAKLRALGCTAISTYAPIFWRFGPRFMDLRLLNEPPHLLYQQLSEVLAAEPLFADAESLTLYRANILWRALGDASHFPYPAPQNTYFPPDLFHHIPSEVLVDCGAFDGDTLREMLALTGDDFAAVHAIEADTVSAARLHAFLATLPAATAAKVRPHAVAVGAERCTLRFAMSGTATSTASGNHADAIEVPCLPLDELLAGQAVTFIKMDIEGAEFDALRGARTLIERDAPVLAICVYHTQSDIWRIPLLLHSLSPGYQFFLRTYDGDGFQTVLYAVPPHRLVPAGERATIHVPLKAVA
jgi:FkbM family methyltransferase